MSIDFSEVCHSLFQMRCTEAIELAEQELRKIPESPFHLILGQPLPDADPLCNWLAKFYDDTSQSITIAALFFDLNEVVAGAKTWSFTCHAYTPESIYSGLDLDHMGHDGDEELEEFDQWLSDFAEDIEVKGMCRDLSEALYIPDASEEASLGMSEGLQAAFANYRYGDDVCDACWLVGYARFVALVRAAHQKGKALNMAWAKLPIFIPSLDPGWFLLSRL